MWGLRAAVQINTGLPGCAGVQFRPMSIFRDECDERQTRVGRMIDEFRAAQSLRRLANATSGKGGDDRAVELQCDAHAQAAVAPSTATASTKR